MNAKKTSNRFSDEELGEYRSAFSLFDKNGDGRISVAELGEVMTALGRQMTKKQLSDMLSQWDIDGNGTVEFPEFLEMMAVREAPSGDDLMDAFKVFDKDGNGFITSDELMQVMKQLGEQLTTDDVVAMIKEVDRDGDGRVNYQEFVTMMQKR